MSIISEVNCGNFKKDTDDKKALRVSSDRTDAG